MACVLSGVATVDASGKASAVGPGKAYIVAVSRADSSRKDSSLVIVKRDVPQLAVGSDTTTTTTTTTTAVATLIFSPKVSQAYGVITKFKWDLDGDGTWDDSAASVDTLKGPVILILSPADNSDTNQTVIDVSWSVDGVLQTAFTTRLSPPGPGPAGETGAGREPTAASWTIRFGPRPIS